MIVEVVCIVAPHDLGAPALGEKVFCIELLGLDDGLAGSLCTQEFVHLHLLVLVALVVFEKAADLQLCTTTEGCCKRGMYASCLCSKHLVDRDLAYNTPTQHIIHNTHHPPHITPPRHINNTMRCLGSSEMSLKCLYSGSSACTAIILSSRSPWSSICMTPMGLARKKQPGCTDSCGWLCVGCMVISWGTLTQKNCCTPYTKPHLHEHQDVQRITVLAVCLCVRDTKVREPPLVQPLVQHLKPD